MIQVPRLYHHDRRAGDIKSMDEMLQNIFRPLFEVTLDPSTHPDLHVFLRQMAGIDSVDDESTRETPTAANEVPADEWTHAENPCVHCTIVYRAPNHNFDQSTFLNRNISDYFLRSLSYSSLPSLAK
jgi:AMP deaminase